MSTDATPAVPRKLYAIPAFPPIAARLMATFARSDIELRSVADLIASEPTFGSRVLQFANSARFSFNSKITSVRHAVSMLGIEEVRNATTTLAMASYYRSSAVELVRCWRHTIACALLAEEIAKATGQFRDQAYTAGVLHDIGRLGLLAAYPSEYQQTVRDAAEHALDLLDYEREKFGLDHCEAGRWLAERWALPEDFRVIAGRHHDPPDGSPFDLCTLVHVACRLADHLDYDVTRPLRPVELDELLAPLPEPARRRLTEEMDRIRKAIELHIAEYGAFLPESAKAAREESPEQAIAELQLSNEFTVCLPDAAPSSDSGGRAWQNAALLAIAAALGGWAWFTWMR